MNYYNYFTEIEETFVRRRGRNLLLSPLDWALIEAWQERNVPLHIILRGIEKVFDGVDQQPSRKRSVKSLTYCREEIEAQYAEWLERQAGKPVSNASSEPSGEETYDLYSRESVSEHLDASINALKAFKESARIESIGQAIGRLEELKRNLPDDHEKTEEILTEIENFLNGELKRNTDAAHLNAVKKDAEIQLSAHKNKMEKEVYLKTLDLMILKRLREEAEIPRLSLYSL